MLYMLYKENTNSCDTCKPALIFPILNGYLEMVDPVDLMLGPWTCGPDARSIDLWILTPYSQLRFYQF